MTEEMQNRLAKANKMLQIKKTAKAIDIIAGWQEMMRYLWALEKDGEISDDEEYTISNWVENENKSVTYDKIKQIRAMF